MADSNSYKLQSLGTGGRSGGGGHHHPSGGSGSGSKNIMRESENILDDDDDDDDDDEEELLDGGGDEEEEEEEGEVNEDDKHDEEDEQDAEDSLGDDDHHEDDEEEEPQQQQEQQPPKKKSSSVSDPSAFGASTSSARRNYAKEDDDEEEEGEVAEDTTRAGDRQKAAEALFAAVSSTLAAASAKDKRSSFMEETSEDPSPPPKKKIKSAAARKEAVMKQEDDDRPGSKKGKEALQRQAEKEAAEEAEHARQAEAAYTTRHRNTGEATTVTAATVAASTDIKVEAPNVKAATASTAPLAAAIATATDDLYKFPMDDPLERLARDALGDLATTKPHGTTAGQSFLSDSLTEEEKRTRTRYVPQVEGMHVLRKHEVKSDLALARTLVGTNTGTNGKSGKPTTKRAASKDLESMDVDEDAGGSGIKSDEDRASSEGSGAASSGSTNNYNIKFDLEMDELLVPSPAFVAPPLVMDEMNGGKNKGGSSKSAAAAVPAAPVVKPTEVDSVTAFDPPRPPESVGAKKKHRLLRWEERPADIPMDLTNYRKTVQRTRQELHHAEAERDRLRTVDNHMRRNWFHHLRCMNTEMQALMEEMASIQQECTANAELLTSRTRNRGAGKGGQLMKDVLAILKMRQSELQEKGISLKTKVATDAVLSNPAVPGYGGVHAVSFSDWDVNTRIPPAPLASAWVLPGDKVTTPVGVGIAEAVHVTSDLTGGQDKKDSMLKGASDVSGPPVAPRSKFDKKAKGKKKMAQAFLEQTQEEEATPPNYKDLPAPRVVVKLPFGTGYFSLSSVVSAEVPCTYSDARLAQRWTKLKASATQVGSVIDLAAMSEFSVEHGKNADVENKMDVDDGTGAGSDGTRNRERKRRLLPFGSGMFPTARGPGNGLFNLDMNEVDKKTESVLFKGSGILGSVNNPGVPRSIKVRESQRQENLDLQAKVLQLRNRLYRQRRIRMLNERTYTATQERGARIESLVMEMRSDLKTLKTRLEEEIRELGISDEHAESILSNFYDSLDVKHAGEPSPPKRQRWEARTDAEEDEDLED